MFKIVLSHAAMRAKKIIAVSQATANSISHHIESVDPKKIEVVYEGVTSFPFIERARTSHRPYILYVGNAFPHKNLEKLLEAFAMLRRTHPEIKLILAGKEDIFYKKLLVGSGDPTHNGVEFKNSPTDDELAELYRNALIYVYPSRIEGFGLPPLEAMSVGVPVVASDIPSLREVLGDAAAFFNPNDARHLSSVLSDLLVSPEKREQLTQKGFEQIKRYSWNKMAVAIQEIYQSCGKKSA